ncbi:MAG TPA: outer membrane protein assembly factor BamB [Burkholderiales bacterium]|nr:outer membrane protein assembly factor BamB [Burkholderiales bacterium]
MKRLVKTCVLASALCTVVLLSACGSMNPLNWFSGSDAPKPAPLVNIDNAVAQRVIWQTKVGSSPSAGFAPVLVQGNIYAAGQDGTVLRVEERTGREIWRVKLPSTLSAGVGSNGKVAVVGTTEGEVVTLDENGRVLWRARVSSEVLAPPAIANDLVVVRSADSRLFAFDVRDGKRRWVYQRAAASLSVRSAVGLTLRNGMAFSGFPGGKLVAVALNNGGLRWEGTVALPKGTTELERVADVIGVPWIGEREACAAAFQGRVACFDLSTGNGIWARDMSSSSGLTVDGRYVFVSEERGAVSALDRASGNSLWRQDKLANRNLSAPLSLGDTVAVGDVEGFVHLLARDTGNFMGRQATDGSSIYSAPIAITEGYLVQTGNGNLYAIAQVAPAR